MISINQLSKSYSGKTILNNLTLEITPGTFTTIHGKSGSGKSTLLNILGLIERYDSGSMESFSVLNPHLNSKEATQLRRHSISYLFQNFALIESENIFTNLAIAQEYQRLSKNQKKYAQRAMLDRVGISEKLTTKVYSLSGGEKQRVALARALLKDHQLILADEPTGSLDIENRNLIIDVLQEEVEKGNAVVIASHDPEIIDLAEIKINLNDL